MSGYTDRLFRAVPRRNFLPPETQNNADIDAPLPIGYGQTNSQPTTVAMMLDWLQVEPGDHLLDVGSGSGWTSALLAKLTGKKGQVTAVEIVPQLVEFGRENCERLEVANVTFYQAGEQYGWPAQAPYDRILVSAAADKVPPELIQQLKPGGRMVIPIDDLIFVIDKDKNGELDRFIHRGFRFVPLIPGS